MNTNTLHTKFARMSNEKLIAKALTLETLIEEKKSEKKIIEDVIADRFDANKSTDEIATAVGVARRVISRQYRFDSERIDEAREVLGLELSEVVEAQMILSVPDERLVALKSRLGDAWGDFMKCYTNYGVRKSFQNLMKKQPATALVLLATPFIRVAEKTSITFKPVES